MKTISALEVRAKFGQVLDAAAAGERFIVERAGAPLAAIVPLHDLDAGDPEAVRARRLAAVDRLVAMRAADRGPRPSPDQIADWLREGRDGTERIGGRASPGSLDGRDGR
jgi:prevent-host-death family protein